jgi:uncharacterized membrane protein YidH (DUF202 family)
MIQSFSDHAANERTFLAWVRTGIAVIALGFVIEKFKRRSANRVTEPTPAPSPPSDSADNGG